MKTKFPELENTDSGRFSIEDQTSISLQILYENQEKIYDLLKELVQEKRNLEKLAHDIKMGKKQ